MAEMNIKTDFITRAVDVTVENGRLTAVKTADREYVEGDAFIDCTGTTGPMGNCMEFGNGCSMCILRCPAFGPRVSISEKAGGRDYYGKRADGTPGAFSGSVKIEKASLSRDIVKQLNKKGVAVVPLPEELINESKLSAKVCRQYALRPFAENVILIDTGYAKMMTPYFPLETLDRVLALKMFVLSIRMPEERGIRSAIRRLRRETRTCGLGEPKICSAAERNQGCLSATPKRFPPVLWPVTTQDALSVERSCCPCPTRRLSALYSVMKKRMAG